MTETTFRALEALAAEPWAITRPALEALAALAERLPTDAETLRGQLHGTTLPGLDAVEARPGVALEGTHLVRLRDGVAIVPVVGPLFRYGNLFTAWSGATSLEQLAGDLTAAAADPQVRGLLLHVDSPGGQVNGLADIARMVERLAAGGKPIRAHVSGSAASGAYWIATAVGRGRLSISETSDVGSIGVVTTILDTRQQERARGARQFVSSGAPNKRPDMETPAGWQEVQAVLDALEGVFVEAVARGRAVDVDTVRTEFGRGGMRVGAAAVAVGMADRVATFEEVFAELAAEVAGGSVIRAGGSTVGVHQTREQRGTDMSGKNDLAVSAETVVSALTVEQLQAGNPGLYERIRAAGHDAGVAAERQRQAAIEGAALPGHDALIARLKADGTSAPDAMAAILQAERAARANGLAAARAEAPRAPAAEPQTETATAPAGGAAPAPAAPAAVPQTAEGWKAEWAGSPALQAEFPSAETYAAFKDAETGGRVRRLAR